jgi:hypothetical protein
MQIKIVTTEYSKDFEKEVNQLLGEGWELHGPPSMITTAHQDTWDDRLRSWSTTTYSQALKKE